MAQLQSTSITGSLIVTQGITGSFSGSATNAVSASYAATASYALNAGDSVWTGSAGNIYYSGGNVGIGTASPGYKLDVRAGSGADAFGFFSGGAGGTKGGIYLGNDGSQYGSLWFDNATNDVVLRQNYINGNLIFGTNFTERMRITSAGVVGIGTTNPTNGSTLEVRGSGIWGGGTLTLTNSGTSGGSWSLFSTNSSFGQGAGKLLIYNTTAGTDAMIIDTSNNVGIGPTSPPDQLSVGKSTGTSVSITSNSAAGTNGSPLNLDINFRGYGDNKMAMIRSWDESASTGDGYLTFSTNYYNGSSNVFTEKMRIGPTGNVGIGTTTPSQKLVVNGRAIVGGGLSGDALSISTSIGTYTFNGYDLLTPSSFLITAGSSGYLSLDGYPVIFKVSGGEKMRVNTNGNVGIGTSVPESKLHVAGGPITLKGGGATDQQILFNFAREYVQGIYNSSGHFRLQDNSLGGTVYQWDGSTFAFPNGSVGIGTTSPAFKLDVNGVTRFQNIVRFKVDSWNLSDDGYSRFYFSNVGRTYFGSGNGYEWRSAADVSIAVLLNNGELIIKGTNAFTTGGTATLSVIGDIISLGASDSDLAYFRRLGSGQFQWQTYNSGNTGQIHLQPYGGNVGIGTTNPAQKLHVEGIARLGGSSTDGALYVYSSNGTLNSLVSGPGDTYLNATYGNVGIGTTSPASKLEVSVTPSAAWMNLINANETAFRLTTFNNGTNNGSSVYAFKHGLYYATTENATITFYRGGSSVGGFLTFTTDNGTERMRIAGDGNVGIGTTNPTVKLQVDNNSHNYIQVNSSVANVQTAINITNSSSTSRATLSWEDGTRGAYADLYSSTYLSITTQSSEKMRITAGGNVGIGTSNPATKLHVVNAGNVAVIGDGNDNYFGNYTSGDYFDIGNLGSTGNVFLEGRGASTNINSQYRAKGAGSHIWSYNAGSNEIMRTTSTGYLGIGTTNPSTKLEVGNFLDAVTNKITVAARYEYEPEFNFRLGQSGTGYDWIGAVISSGDDGNYNGKISFKTANAGRDTPTTKMVIKANGNVGIGTTSPGALLDVNGSLGSGKSIIRVTNSDTTNYITVGAGIPGISNAGMNLTLDGTSRMVISAAGNVGIGTISPAYKLEVNGTGRFNGELTVVPSATNGITISRAGGYASIYGSNDLVFETDSIFYFGVYTPRLFSVNGSFYTTANGNVGIGTASPSYKLDVIGNSRIYGSYLVVDQTSGYNTSIILNQSGLIQWYMTNQASTGKLVFGNGNGDLISILQNGNVGIGLTTPQKRLDVYGSAGIIGSFGAGLSVGQFAGIHFGYTESHIGNDSYKKSALVFERTDNNNQGGNASGKIHFLLNNSGGSSATTLSAAVVTIDSDANGTVGSVRMGVGTRNPTATLNVSGSTNVLNVRGSGSAVTSSIFSVDGNNGRLFEVSDDLSNSLFSVNTIAGLPVIEAFADYTVTMGTYGAYSLQVTGSRVGVGTSSPGYPLHVSGSVSGISIYATNDIAAFSDQSVKTDLQVIDSAVDRIKQINGYTYVRVDDLSNTRRAGVIAQEVQKVLPEVVSENSDGTLNVAYSNMIALLIEGMKEQQAQIDKLREDLEDLRYEL